MLTLRHVTLRYVRVENTHYSFYWPLTTKTRKHTHTHTHTLHSQFTQYWQ